MYALNNGFILPQSYTQVHFQKPESHIQIHQKFIASHLIYDTFLFTQQAHTKLPILQI